MIDFFTKKILYFSTWPESFGDGINNLKQMYCALNQDDFRSLFHVNINSTTNRCIWWMLHCDNLIDRLYIHPEYENTVKYLGLFDTKYDEVYFGTVLVDNYGEVYDWFSKQGIKCHTLYPPRDPKFDFGHPFLKKEAFRQFKSSFANQRKEIFKFINTSKIAIIMPFSTRRYAAIAPDTVLKICEMLNRKDYTVLVCGEYSSPYTIKQEYDAIVENTMALLREKASDKVISLVGMSASKTAELAKDCNVFLHASTGAVQMSYYDYAKCPWIILENGREDMMNGLSKIFSSTGVKIVEVTCEHKYCQRELRTNPNCDQKIKDCNNGVSRCIEEEFNYNRLEQLIDELA